MIIITAVGPDRPGMAHAVAVVLARADCNIEDTTMTRLCGEFAMILIVSPPPQQDCAALASQLAPLENSHGLFINCKEIIDTAQLSATYGGADKSNVTHAMLSVYGPENRGLVSTITGVLAEHSVNITDVQTRVASAGTVYVMIFELELPPSLEVQTLKHALEEAAATTNMQVSLHPLEEDML